MSTFRNPVGPQPSNVYWRRRLIVGAGVLVVLIVILLIVFSPKGTKTPAGVHSSASPAASPASTAAASDLKDCAPADVTVTATVDKPKYTVEEQPQLGFTITNTSKAACNFAAGSDKQVFTVTSGKDTIWTSTDCQTSPAPAVVALQPGVALPGGPVAWDRTRSSKTTCDAQRTAVTAGGATYRLGVTINGVAAKDTVPFILN